METKDKKVETTGAFIDAYGQLQNFEGQPKMSIHDSYLLLGLFLLFVFAIINVLAFGISKLFE